MSCRPALAIAALLAAGCAGRRTTAEPPRVVSVPSPTVRVGECGAPEKDGVMSERPRPRRADRDLDGDGQAETVVADEAMCTADGNCYWNVFVRGLDGDGGCERYAGALAGQALEPRGGATPGTLASVRAYWNLTGGGRMLVHEYQFRRGGYVLIDTLLCRRADDDRLQCTEDLR